MARLSKEEYKKSFYERVRLLGGEVLGNYVDYKTKVKVKCGAGHVFDKLPTKVRTTWCIECHFDKKKNKTSSKFFEILEKEGHKFIDRKYLGYFDKHPTICPNGHEWGAVPNYVLCDNNRCPICYGNIPLTLEDLREEAAKRGGCFLSEECQGSLVPHSWKCKNGHVFSMTPNNVQQGHWCAECNKRTIEEIRQFAINKGGKFLSDVLGKFKEKHSWQCSKGHIWSSVLSKVMTEGQWCRKCNVDSQKLSIEELRLYAINKGGVLLSEEYNKSSSKYKWQCSKGHIWEALANSVLNKNSWCPECYLDTKTKYNIDEMLEIAKNKGGKFISDNYKTTSEKYEWECTKGHRWTAKAISVLSGHWCPRCVHQQSSAELKIYDFVKSIYSDAVSGKTKLLRNPYFELDIYVPSLRKAIEYDGRFWHKSEWAIANGLTERDVRKNEQCKEADIDLLRIDEEEYLNTPEVVYDKIKRFLNA